MPTWAEGSGYIGRVGRKGNRLRFRSRAKSSRTTGDIYQSRGMGGGGGGFHSLSPHSIEFFGMLSESRSPPRDDGKKSEVAAIAGRRDYVRRALEVRFGSVFLPISHWCPGVQESVRKGFGEVPMKRRPGPGRGVLDFIAVLRPLWMNPPAKQTPKKKTLSLRVFTEFKDHCHAVFRIQLATPKLEMLG